MFNFIRKLITKKVIRVVTFKLDVRYSDMGQYLYTGNYESIVYFTKDIFNRNSYFYLGSRKCLKSPEYRRYIVDWQMRGKLPD